MVAKVELPEASYSQRDGKYLIAVRFLDGETKIFQFHAKHDRAIFLDGICRRYKGEFEWSLAESD